MVTIHNQAARGSQRSDVEAEVLVYLQYRFLSHFGRAYSTWKGWKDKPRLLRELRCVYAASSVLEERIPILGPSGLQAWASSKKGRYGKGAMCREREG